MSDQPAPTDSGDVGRLIFFSDAVVAIAMTLLALELPVPAGHTVSEFWRSVRDNEGHYVAFLVSFAVIAFMWTQHHKVFDYAAVCDNRLRTLDLIWLLTIVLVPFATKLLTDAKHDTTAVHAIRFGFYSLLLVLALLTFSAMVHHLVSHGLLKPKAPIHVSAVLDDGTYHVMAGFALSIPVFFLTQYAWVLWIIVPLGLTQFSRWRLRHRAGTT